MKQVSDAANPSECDTVFIMSMSSFDGIDYITWHDGTPRIYERDEYDPRLHGFGKLEYFSDFNSLVRHFFKNGELQTDVPVQAATSLLSEFGFSKRAIARAMRTFNDNRVQVAGKPKGSEEPRPKQRSQRRQATDRRITK